MQHVLGGHHAAAAGGSRSGARSSSCSRRLTPAIFAASFTPPWKSGAPRSRTMSSKGGPGTTVSGRDGSKAAGGPSSGGSQFYLNFTGFPFPIGPTFQRKTVRYEVRGR